MMGERVTHHTYTTNTHTANTHTHPPHAHQHCDQHPHFHHNYEKLTSHHCTHTHITPHTSLTYTRARAHHPLTHSPTTCLSTEMISPRFRSFAHLIASYPHCIVVIHEMASAWLTLQQHALDISTLAPAHSTPKGAQPLYTHNHPNCETNTHVIFVVDVGFGFEQCDGGIGMTPTSSHHQRRPITLQTHNDTERQPKCAGIPHLTRTLSLWSMLALALTNSTTQSVRPQ